MCVGWRLQTFWVHTLLCTWSPRQPLPHNSQKLAGEDKEPSSICFSRLTSWPVLNNWKTHHLLSSIYQSGHLPPTQPGLHSVPHHLSIREASMGELHTCTFARDYPSNRRQNWGLNPGKSSFIIFLFTPVLHLEFCSLEHNFMNGLRLHKTPL